MGAIRELSQNLEPQNPARCKQGDTPRCWTVCIVYNIVSYLYIDNYIPQTTCVICPCTIRSVALTSVCA